MRLGRFNISENHVVIYQDEPDMSFLDSVDSLSNSNHYEYQIRWVDSPIYYKRARGTNTWSFCSDKDFAENVTPDNLVKWNKSEVNNRKDPFNSEELFRAIRAEMMQGEDLDSAREIVIENLRINPNYYKNF